MQIIRADGQGPSALITLRDIRDRPDTLIQVIGHNNRFSHIFDDEFTMELYLIRETAPYPIGIHLVPLAVDDDIKRLDLPVIVKGSDDRDNLHGQIIMGVGG